jgi:hypothetical protein
VCCSSWQHHQGGGPCWVLELCMGCGNSWCVTVAAAATGLLLSHSAAERVAVSTQQVHPANVCFQVTARGVPLAHCYYYPGQSICDAVLFLAVTPHVSPVAHVCDCCRSVMHGLLPEDEAAAWVRANKGGKGAASTPVKSRPTSAAVKRPAGETDWSTYLLPLVSS